tara:strand:+ start:4511 stop:5251 length:741 start_codon:yes stop_codon:yes gene_type:complete
MDYIKLLQAQVNKWKGEQKCGFCWEFDAPLLDSGVNKSQTREDCCTYVYATNISVRESRSFDSVTGLTTERYDEVSLTIEIVRKSDIGDNVYREMEYPLDQSKWASIISPIKECLNSDFPFDFCEIANRDFQITSRSWAVIANNIHDNNYVGWRISLSLRDNDPTLNYIANIVAVNAIDIPGNPYNGIITLESGAFSLPLLFVDGWAYFDNTEDYQEFLCSGRGTPVITVPVNSYNEMLIDFRLSI